MQIKKHEHNHNHKRLIEEKLLDYLDKINVSGRDKKVVVSYAEGKAYKEIALLYGISTSRVAAVISRYVRYAHRHINQMDASEDSEVL